MAIVKGGGTASIFKYGAAVFESNVRIIEMTIQQYFIAESSATKTTSIIDVDDGTLITIRIVSRKWVEGVDFGPTTKPQIESPA
ncbi:hypothetical protein WA026_012039 [Henosepilachna vigintioctopunctata]|uniref:Uncharacterized protein n=1 Tax=Henosepilachna vigintioctopunctata TaxID=420089 RepID=A0AAW1VFA9_9CUCU